MAATHLSANEVAFLGDAQPWGVILMGRSCDTPEQVRALVDQIWSAMQRPCLIFIDQEGGRVRRLRPPKWPDFPPGAVYAALYAKDRDLGLEAAFLGHRLMAEELAPIGIHADCAPVLDLLHPGAHDIVGDRAFGSKPDAVAALGRAALRGLAAGGVAGVIKHMPGHGWAKLDSHEALPVVAADETELAADMAPFAALNDAPMAMTAHIAYDAFDPGVAATVSKTVIQNVIRTRIGFDGLLMSDDLGMKALGGALSDRVVRSLGAGCDVALHCAGFETDPNAILQEMIEVSDACPELGGDALRRADKAETAARRPHGIDKIDARARFDALLAKTEGMTV
ncbi:MAG: beta-N-acetylhexosaminidase [Pseudomonadota bacterium]